MRLLFFLIFEFPYLDSRDFPFLYLSHGPLLGVSESFLAFSHTIRTTFMMSQEANNNEVKYLEDVQKLVVKPHRKSLEYTKKSPIEAHPNHQWPNGSWALLRLKTRNESSAR